MEYRLIQKKDLNNYELDNKKLSYANLFYNDDSLILCNNIISNWEDVELMNGTDYNEEEDTYEEIYQYYIIDDNTAKRLINYTNEIIYYHYKLDIYILGVTHYGTGWSHVLTDFKLIKTDDDNWYRAIKDEDDNND